jgi:hypothetical protein
MQESLLHGKEAVMLLNHPYLSEGHSYKHLMVRKSKYTGKFVLCQALRDWIYRNPAIGEVFFIPS